MRIATCAVSLCGAVLGSCAGPGAVPAEFAAAIAAAAPDGSGRIAVDGAAIRELSAPVAVESLPPAVARIARAIQPGGTSVAAERVWSAAGTAYRVTTRYGNGDDAEQRTVLLDPEAAVIERSHALPLHEVDAPVRARIERLDRGTIRAAEVVQRGPGEELFRFWLEQRDGARSVAQCRLDGSGLRIARVVPAELWSWQDAPPR